MDWTKLIPFLLVITSIALVPIYLFRRNWKETLSVGLILLYFLFIFYPVWQKIGIYHDARIGYGHIFAAIKQWIDTGTAIGWNPYMNGGEPLYLFSNLYLWTPWYILCWVNRFFGFGAVALQNFLWLFLFFNFSCGSYLFFSVFYNSRKAALFSFFVLVTSTMLIINLGQPAGLYTLYYLPYILFSLICGWRRKNFYGIFFSVIFFGASLNHYLPHYLFLSLAVIFLSFFCFYFKAVIVRVKEILSLKSFIFLGFSIVIALIIAMPAFFSYNEAKDYISPQRDGSMLGEVKEEIPLMSYFEANAPFFSYRVLLEQTVNYRGNVHNAFFFGVLALLFVPLSLFRIYDKKIVCCVIITAVFVILGLGRSFFVFRFLIERVSFFSLLRTPFVFSQFASFFLVVLAGFGFREFIDITSPYKKRLYQTLVLSLTAGVFILISPKLNVIIFSLSGVICSIIFLFFSRSNKGEKYKRYIWILVFFTAALEMTACYYHFNNLFSLREKQIQGKEAKKNVSSVLERDNFKIPSNQYPIQRNFYSSGLTKKTPDYMPLLMKLGFVTHIRDAYIQLRNRRFHDILNYGLPNKILAECLGAGESTVYFTSGSQVLPKGASQKEILSALYLNSAAFLNGKGRNVIFNREDIDFVGENSNSEKNKAFISFEDQRKNPNQLDIFVTTSKKGFLVRSENFNKGWKAYVDGERTKIYRADYAFFAVPIEEGKHKISFVFQTPYQILVYLHITLIILAWFGFNLYLARYPFR